MSTPARVRAAWRRSRDLGAGLLFGASLALMRPEWRAKFLRMAVIEGLLKAGWPGTPWPYCISCGAREGDLVEGVGGTRVTLGDRGRCAFCTTLPAANA